MSELEIILKQFESLKDHRCLSLQDFMIWYCSSNGVTQTELARRLEISRSAVSAWMTGLQGAHPHNIARLAEITGYHPVVLAYISLPIRDWIDDANAYNYALSTASAAVGLSVREFAKRIGIVSQRLFTYLRVRPKYYTCETFNLLYTITGLPKELLNQPSYQAKIEDAAQAYFSMRAWLNSNCPDWSAA